MGMKMFVLTSYDGLVHDFEIYVGKRTLHPSNHSLDISGWCFFATYRLSTKKLKL